MLFSKKPLLIFASALALSGCLGNDQPNTASPANPDNNVTVITLKNNPYLKATNHIQQIQSNRLSTASLASSEEITNPNSTVVDHPKIHRSDEEVYMGIPIMNNTGSPISGFYIHNWDRTAGNYINGYNMMWESGVEIAHTMQNNKYHDWYFPVGTTEANVNSSSLMWDAYGYLGGHWSATDSAYGSTSWTLELQIQGRCYYTHSSGRTGMLDSLDGWSGDRMNAWTQPVFQGAWAQLGMDIAALEQTLYSWLSGQCVNSNCPTPQNGMWSEFTPDNNGGYYWIVHAGTGVALQQPDGSWLSKVLASNDSKANAIFDLTPTSSCDSINEKLPKSHPSGMSLPSGNWQSNCGALSWDGNTLTTQCNGTDNPSSLDMGMCSASDITVDLAMDKVSLMCGAGLYDANITALINANSATPNPFLSTSSSKCQILDVTDDSPESTIATAAGISSITAECYSQPLQLSSGSGIVPVVSTIDPQSCVLPSGSYDIVSLNGSLACGGGSASAPNDIGAVISSGSDFATAAVPLTNSAGIIQVLQSEDQWLGTDINPVNNVSYINWSQVCTDNNLMFSPGTDNLQCDNYQSDLTPLLQANTTLFNGSVGSSQTNNPCNIIGASRDESGNLQEIEYTCAYSSNVPYGASGFYNYTGTINPSACYDNVMVESAGSGELSCSLQPPSPTINISGSWKNSCYNATFDGNNLTATCRFNNNEYVQSTLAFYSTCAGNSTVSNNNGYLECDEYGGYWSTQLLSTNNWLAEGNNSCIIQNVAFTPPPGSGVTNITAMCQGQYGYNQTSINPSKCPLFRGQQLIILQNNNGSLVCG